MTVRKMIEACDRHAVTSAPPTRQKVEASRADRKRLLWSQNGDRVPEMLLILKSIFDLIVRGQVLHMTGQRSVPRCCTGSICG